jgi:transposase
MIRNELKIKEYLETGFTYDSIVEKLNCSKSTIKQVKDKYNIPVKKRKNTGKKSVKNQNQIDFEKTFLEVLKFEFLSLAKTMKLRFLMHLLTGSSRSMNESEYKSKLMVLIAEL